MIPSSAGGAQEPLEWKFVQSFGDDNSSDGPTPSPPTTPSHCTSTAPLAAITVSDTPRLPSTSTLLPLLILSPPVTPLLCVPPPPVQMIW